MKKHAAYLFLDMEWNQAPGTTDLEGREAIQIGVLAADTAMKKVKSFSKDIQLKHPELLSTETIKVTHTTANNIMQARPEDIVLTNFSQTFPEYQYIVVWSQETFELFKRDMKNYKIPMQKHQVIVLQEVVNAVAGNGKKMIGFELALIGAGIDYIPNYLHYSKHDANYLYQLFCTCRQQFIQATADEYCIVNTNTKKLHTRNCRYVRNMPLEKILMKPKSSIFKGYLICKCCGTKEEWKRLNWTYIRKSETSSKKDKSKILKQLPLTEKNIDIICRHFQVSYSVSNAAVFICTAYAVDYKLISICHKGDIVVSQDYGVAAMALGKGAYAIHQSGKWYTNDNIDQMLMERHLNKKARRSSHKNHVKGPKKRTEEDDERFAQSFEKMILMAQKEEKR